MREANLPIILASIIFLSSVTWVPTIVREIRKVAPSGKTQQPPREAIYRGVILGQLWIIATAFVIVFAIRMPVFGEIQLNLKPCLLALAFLALNHLCVEPLEWKTASSEYKRKVRHFCPHTIKERLLYVPTALITALSEEVVYRAVFFGLFYQAIGIYWIAGVASAVFFSINHVRWSVSAVATTFFVGLGLQYLVFISGGLYLPIAVHFIHNLINGIIFGRVKQSMSNLKSINYCEIYGSGEGGKLTIELMEATL